jgi:hypothetical protein
MNRSRRWCAVVVLGLLLFPLAVTAQFRGEVGLQSCGRLATEVTHYVRCPSLPGALYVGASMDAGLRKGLSLTTKVQLQFGRLVIEQCDSPCPSIGRAHRPQLDRIVAEPDFNVIDVQLGLRQQMPGPFDIAAGLALPIVDGPYGFFGATPMLVYGGFAEIRVELPVAPRMKAGIVCASTIIPPQARLTPRWTTLSEWSGYKRAGADWPTEHKSDPVTVSWLRCGAVVGGR